MDFENIRVSFERSQEGEWLSVVEADGDRIARGPLGLDIATIENAVEGVGSWETLLLADQDAPERELARKSGEALYRALFAGDAGDLFRSVWWGTPARETGLCLRLRFRFDERKIARLAWLPWELLHDPSGSDFLLLHPHRTLVRSFELSQPGPLSQASRPLRILIAVASPRGLIPLEFQREIDELTKVTAGRPFVVEVLQGGTLEDLQNRLEEAGGGSADPPAIFHFIGHGQICSSENEAKLLFEYPDMEADGVDAGSLARVLRGSSIRLVVLNACSAGTIPEDPGKGFAPRLLECGADAVIALQLPIQDRAAVRFSEALYRQLAITGRIDKALAYARLKLAEMERRSNAWAVPVLYLRRPDGFLFDLAPREPKPWWQCRIPLLGIELTLALSRNERLQGDPEPMLVHEGALSHRGLEIYGATEIQDSTPFLVGENHRVYVAKLDFDLLAPTAGNRRYRQLEVEIELAGSEAEVLDFYPLSLSASEPRPQWLTLAETGELLPVFGESDPPPGSLPCLEWSTAVAGSSSRLGHAGWRFYPDGDGALLPGPQSVYVSLRVARELGHLEGTVVYRVELEAPMLGVWEPLGSAEIAAPISWKIPLVTAREAEAIAGEESARGANP